MFARYCTIVPHTRSPYPVFFFHPFFHFTIECTSVAYTTHRLVNFVWIVRAGLYQVHGVFLFFFFSFSFFPSAIRPFHVILKKPLALHTDELVDKNFTTIPAAETSIDSYSFLLFVFYFLIFFISLGKRDIFTFILTLTVNNEIIASSIWLVCLSMMFRNQPEFQYSLL